MFHAIKTGRIEIANYLIATGASLEIGYFDKNALDYLIESKYIDLDKKQILANNMLTVNIIIPRRKENITSLQPLTHVKLDNYTNANIIFTPNEMAIIKTLNQKIHIGAITHYLGSTFDYKIFTEACQQRIANEILTKLQPKNWAMLYDLPEEVHYPNKEVTAQENKDITNRGSLAFKTMYHAKHLNELKELAHSLQSKSDLDTEKEGLYHELVDKVNTGSWIEVEEALDGHDDIEKYTILLNLAIARRASQQQILSYAQKGGLLEDSSTLFIIRDDNLSLAKALKPYDLNLSEPDKTGYSAIQLSAMLNAHKIITYIIEEGIDVNNYGEGFDALDFALQYFHPPYDSGKKTISLLINNGAIIKQSHKELTSEIKDTNIDSYLDLITQYPSLKL